MHTTFYVRLRDYSEADDPVEIQYPTIEELRAFCAGVALGRNDDERGESTYELFDTLEEAEAFIQSLEPEEDESP